MSSRASRPGTDAVVGANKRITNVHSIVAICVAAYQLAIDKGASITAPVVGAEGVGEGAGWRREEWGRERSRGSLREEGNSRLESKGRDLILRRRGTVTGSGRGRKAPA